MTWRGPRLVAEAVRRAIEVENRRRDELVLDALARAVGPCSVVLVRDAFGRPRLVSNVDPKSIAWEGPAEA